jgi:Pyruvate/2-oxoacid:ferredoxin oxidoreductase delta subunit
MGDIVKFDECMETEKKKRKQERIKKLNAMRKTFECTKCALKCTRCGTQVDISRTSFSFKEAPYRFCKGCEDEFKDFLDKTKGNSRKELYWHNHEWMAMWQAWIHYQGAIKKYENSDEFKKLLNELSRGLE